MKKLYNWKFALFMSVFIALLLLSSVLYADFVTLPSENWSKYITLYQSDVTDQTQNYYDDIFDVVDYDHQLLLTFSDKQKLHFNILNLSGEIQKSFTYDLNTNVKKISTEINLNVLTVLIATETTLNQYNFNLSDFTLNAQAEITNHFESVKLDGKNAVVYVDDTFYFFNGTNLNFVSENSKVEQFDFQLDQNKLFINLLEYNLGGYYFSLYRYDINHDELFYKENMQKVNAISGTISLDTDLFIKEDHLYNCMILKNTKYGQNFETNLIVDKNTLDIIESVDSSNMSYDPNTQFVSYNDQVYIAYNDKSFIGKLEIGSQFKTYTNVFLRPITKGQEIEQLPFKILTKSQNYAPNFKFITVDKLDYLITNEIDHGQNVLYISSNEPNIIKQSTKLALTDYQNIFFGALTYIPASLMTSWMVIIGLLFPVIFVVIPIAIIKMNWVERNPIKMLYSAILAYLLVKIYYVFSNFDLLLFSNTSMGTPPFHLSSVFLSSLTFIFTTGISLLCIHLFLKNKPQTHFITAFFFFFVFEMIQYLFYITTYAVMYM
ncbi:hypothetical protein [Fusibacter sp. 3D3]|uniref:hypothetical protein n=1 Tax=Fusibacter sp. 3D3 TaxID=1048380 RepID=UPI0008529C4C|nr:hypothetical protein [Fusibacter sp. 3D3]GAU75796.1 hypothetical protein F3D3_0389 [Fusibacter sp. 3D3]